MAIVFHELGEHGYHEIGRIEDGEIIEGEEDLTAIGADQFADSEKRLLNAYDGPYIVAGIASDTTEKSERALQKSVEAIFKEWIPYEGPQGGEGWQNTLTGEVRYQETKPTGAGSGDADISVPANSTVQTVSRAITSVLGATVLQSLKQQATGGGGSFNPQTLVTAAALYIAQSGRGSLADLQDALNEEAEEEPEDAEDITVEVDGKEAELTTQTGPSDVTGAITEVAGQQTVAILASRMDDDEQADAEAWTRTFLEDVDEYTAEEFQEALDQRIRERTISTDRYRGGVVVPNDLSVEEAQAAMQNTLHDQTYHLLEDLMVSDPSVNENDADTWVRAALTQIGDDNNLRSEFQNQFDVSTATSEGEGVESVVLSGGGEEIEMPTGTTAEDAREAIGETFGDDALRMTAHSIDQREEDPEDPRQWIMSSLTFAHINNPDGFESAVTQLQDSLIDNGDEADGESESGGSEETRSRSDEVVSGHDPEGDWQSFVEPVTDLLEEGESPGDIVQSLKETAEVGGHGLQDEQIRQVALESHKEATERNPGIQETPDTPSLAMDWGNEFPEAMRDRMQERFPDAYERLNETFEPWSENPHDESMASLWNYAIRQTGNANIPEMEGRPENVSQEDVESIQRLHETTRDTLEELYGDAVPVYRPVRGEAARQLTGAVEAEEEEAIEFSHRPAEAWSSDVQQIAERTEWEDQDVAVVRREVPTDQVLAASVTGAPGLDPEDNEFVVMSGSQTEYEPDDVLTQEDLKDPKATLEEVWWATDTAGGDEQTADEGGDSE